MSQINELRDEAYKNAKAKGFYERDFNLGEALCHIHAEVSEACEADRIGKYCNRSPNALNTIVEDDRFKVFYKEVVKGSFEEEMADIVIRVLNLCGYKNIDLEGHILAKMRYNSMREHKHGKAY